MKASLKDVLLSENLILNQITKIFSDVLVLDLRFRIVSLSSSLQGVLGYSEAQLVGKRIDEIIVEKNQLGFILKEFSQNGYCNQQELHFLDHQQNALLFSASIFHLGYFTDFKNRIIVQIYSLEEVKIAVESLEFKSFELEEFLYRASHDLRGPIATMKGLYSILDLTSANESEKDTCLMQIKYYLDQLDHILKNILQLTDQNIYVSNSNLNKTMFTEDDFKASLSELVHRIDPENTLKIEILVESIACNNASCINNILAYIKNLLHYLIQLKHEENPFVVLMISSFEHKTKVQVKANHLVLEPEQQSLIQLKYLSGTYIYEDSSLAYFYAAQKIASRMSAALVVSVKSLNNHSYTLNVA